MKSISSSPHIAKLGSYTLCNLPASYSTRFVDPGKRKSKYSIIIGGANFRCGSSGEHAPVALGVVGVAAVVAKSYARFFFRNSVATGEVETEIEIKAPAEKFYNIFKSQARHTSQKFVLAVSREFRCKKETGKLMA
ncbi:hypothetical protein ACFX1X_020866 [Malus domestica]